MSKVYCIMGGSGAGKDTIKNFLPLPHIVSYRTRPIREGEIDGVNGHFVTDKDYERAKELGIIAAYTLYNGHHYWTTTTQFEDILYGERKPIVYVVDRDGVESLKTTLGDDKVFAIWLEVPEGTLFNRMVNRGDSIELVQDRMRNHREIIDYEKHIADVEVIDDGKARPDQVANAVAMVILKDLYGRS